MIGGTTSSLSLAQRTATKARATMDTMARQIATGQKVSSVKDDGAAWARANQARGDASSSQALSSSLGFIRVGLGAAIALGESRSEILTELRGIALSAIDTSLSAGSRQQLQTRFTTLRDSYLNELTYSAAVAETVPLANSGGGSWAPFSALAGDADLTWTETLTGATASQALSPISGPAGDVSTTVTATATNGSLQNVENQILLRVAALARLDGRMGSLQTRLDSAADRLVLSAATLTDADLGKASAERARAETRQQLALDTIRTAISAYGNFAGGLLGNVQRTQRGVLA